jgi:hypothetical protein
MVGDPVAYATGSPELKAMGPSSTVSNSPITKSQRGLFCGGVPQTHFSSGDNAVPGFEAAQEGSLEARTIAAHRAYVTALVAWERTIHRATCPVCRPEHVATEDLRGLCAAAEAEKERCRIAFRDLCDEFGFVPTGHGIALPAEDQSCCRSRSTD